jgi:tetraacyldisaccharide 4'-kinase
VATTQKDWVKLRVPDLAGRALRAVRVGLHLRSGEAELAAALERVAPAPRPAPGEDDGFDQPEE